MHPSVVEQKIEYLLQTIFNRLPDVLVVYQFQQEANASVVEILLPEELEEERQETVEIALKREIAIGVDVKVDCLTHTDEVILLFIGQQSVRVVPYDVEQLPLLLLLLAFCQLLGQASHADVLVEVWHFSFEVDPACRDLRPADLSSRKELEFFLYCLACDLIFLIADVFPTVVDSLSY